MPDMTFFKIFLGARLERARRAETGASAVEWVVITALLVGVALAVGVIMMKKFTGKADSLDLQ